MKSLEKFMDAMGLDYDISVDRTYFSYGKHVCCIKIEVFKGEDKEYIQYHCYSLKRNGEIKYEEGNEVKGIHSGALKYLGDDRNIDNYIDNKAREIAKKTLINTK